MPKYLENKKSISNKLISIKDIVRNFIDDGHREKKVDIKIIYPYRG